MVLKNLGIASLVWQRRILENRYQATLSIWKHFTSCLAYFCGESNHRLLIVFFSFLRNTVAQKGQTQISLPKHKTVSQNTNQFPQLKSVDQNTNQFPKTQISLPKQKIISQNTNQFSKTQISLPKHKSISAKHKSKDWALTLLLSESLEGTHSQDFPRPTQGLLINNQIVSYHAQKSRANNLIVLV